MEQERIDLYCQMLIELNTKYKDNAYMLQRLESHLQSLGNVLEQEQKKYDERLSRHNELTLEQDNFHKVFLSKHQYYYMPYNNSYYEYDGKKYKIVKEDDIHYNLLSSITNEGKLVQWKHKTKQTIIKHIKDRILIKSTPETYTIQNVLGYLQTIFETKSEAKYFLTVIGDCILKKNTDGLLYFVSSSAKKLVTLIDYVSYITTGTNIMSHFITKYHESHKISSYRLIKIKETSDVFPNEIVNDVLNIIGIDLICVACHYSERYSNGDNYLKTKTDDGYAQYFIKNPLEKIVDDFVSCCIEKVTTETNMHWKNMHYIWKLYLSQLKIPNMVYSSQLQTILSGKLENTIESNGNLLFTHITSKYLPSVSSFLSFWEKHVVISEHCIDFEYEIDELLSLYKTKGCQISESSMIKIICHYFAPQVQVIGNKYVTNITCNLWNKQDDISDFLKSYKAEQSKNLLTELISFDDLYNDYKTYIKATGLVEQKNYLIVSKQFFEKYITSQLTNYIEYEKFVSPQWLLS
jgi:hypothetical protein